MQRRLMGGYHHRTSARRPVAQAVQGTTLTWLAPCHDDRTQQTTTPLQTRLDTNLADQSREDCVMAEKSVKDWAKPMVKFVTRLRWRIVLFCPKPSNLDPQLRGQREAEKSLLETGNGGIWTRPSGIQIRRLSRRRERRVRIKFRPVAHPHHHHHHHQHNKA
jgi:hypothetical protein